MSFDKLEDVRSLARAQAVESFEHFAGAVLGLSLEPEFCRAVQESVETYGVFTVLPEQQSRASRAVQLWLCVLGLRSELVENPNDTFHWLFPELCVRRGNVAA